MERLFCLYSSYEKSDIAWTEYFDYHVGQLNKLEKATNIKWKKEGENYTVVFDRDKRSDAIESLEMKIRSNGIERIINPGGYGYGPSEDGVTIGVIDIASAYTYSNEQPEPVYFSVRFKIATSAVNQYQLITSDYSDWSEELLYNPFNKKMVESIELWPQTPYILVGNNLNIGKTIAPTDAWYSKVNWSSADPNIASVDVMGKVYGNSAGTTTITGMVQGVSANADVTVYEIKSNIADAASKEVAVDKAAEVIDSIVNNGDASGTDITSVSEARASIETGMNNKDIFDVELSDEVKEEDDA